MTRTITRNFGKAFEDKGDYRRAFETYHSEGKVDAAARVHRILEVIELSTKLREISHIRAVDVLIENGLVKEARAFVKDVEQRDTNESSYAKLRVLAIDGMSQEMRTPCDRLESFGSYGKYLAAMALIKESPNTAKLVADHLSGKQSIKVSPKPETEWTEAHQQHRMFLSAAEVGTEGIGRGMMSLLQMEEKGEKEYFGMRIYEKLGMHEEVVRCRGLLVDASDRIKFYARFDTTGKYEQDDSTIKLTNNLRFFYAISTGTIEGVIHVIEKYGRTEDDKYKATLDLIWDLDKFLPQIIDNSGILKLLEYMKTKKQALTKVEEEKLVEFAVRLNEAGKDLEKIKEAAEFLGNVNFSYLKSSYWNYKQKCADVAFELGTDEAIIFAAKIYENVDFEKAFSCAEILLERGCVEEAKIIYANLAIYLGKKYKENKDMLTAQKLLKKAAELEDNYPALSMYVYKEFDDKEAVKRTAELILQKGTEEDLEVAGWTLSIINKRGELTHRILQRLSEKGEEGKKKAQAIIIEMRIPPLFAVA
ncbi:MAG: hypothetical protein AABX38_05950 [Candidatus Micrarchaeota archaeon]